MATVTQPQRVSQTVMIQESDWSSGICDCCDDMSICCCACWCFSCFQCSTANKFGECLCLPILDGVGLCTLPISLSVRAAARERFNIRGSICGDCCTNLWCLPCAWCQLAREMKVRNRPVTIMNAYITDPANTSYNPKLRAHLA
ncbi:cornifelin-like [Protopterus annectens]|uniref:cornifelin-like n=1 Tax=Protopterus annectens TaxID=7888 RepID=UPI001CF9E498|nr:cornifelin-like [Protopterus annectens]XP_043932672.1 cornifelin-like [Protopterus annectens]